MTELFSSAKQAYQAEQSKLMDPNQPTDFEATQALDKRIAQIIFFLQRNLKPDQALAMQIDASPAPKLNSEDSNNIYLDSIKQEPQNFRYRLGKIANEYGADITGFQQTKIPHSVTMVIPANLYPKEDLGFDTGRLRQALYNGEIKHFFKPFGDFDIRGVEYLTVNLLGHLPGIDLSFHPSIIKEIKIVRLDQAVNSKSKVIFK